MTPKSWRPHCRGSGRRAGRVFMISAGFPGAKPWRPRHTIPSETRRRREDISMPRCPRPGTDRSSKGSTTGCADNALHALRAHLRLQGQRRGGAGLNRNSKGDSGRQVHTHLSRMEGRSPSRSDPSRWRPSRHLQSRAQGRAVTGPCRPRGCHSPRPARTMGCVR